MNPEATAQFIVALNLWAALTSNSGDGGVKGEQRTENREKVCSLLELLRFATKSKGGRHARCLNSCASLRSPRVEGMLAA